MKLTLFSLALRHSRRLSTTATTVEPTIPRSIPTIQKKLKSVRDPDEALQIYKSFRHSRRLSTTAISVEAATPPSIPTIKTKLKNVSNPDEALKIYNSFNFDSTHYSSNSFRDAQEFTVRLLAKSGRLSDIENFLESHKSTPHITHEHFLACLIRSYGASGMLENAVKTYEQMDEFGTPRSVLSFNALLWACTECKLFDRVVTYFDEFPAKFGFLPDIKSYGILIKSYCDMGLPEIAIEKINEMQGKGFEQNVIKVFNIGLHSLYANGRIKEAESFWDEMVKEKGFKPDSFSYDIKLRHLQPGDRDGFKRLVEEMNNVGVLPDSFTCHTILKFYCENEMMDEANTAYDKMMRQKGCGPSVAAFRTLVFHKCKSGEFLSAYMVYKGSVKHGKVLDFSMLKCLAEGLVEKGYKKEAKHLIFKSMENVSAPDLLETWRQLADAADALGLRSGSLDEMEESGDLAPRVSEL